MALYRYLAEPFIVIDNSGILHLAKIYQSNAISATAAKVSIMVQARNVIENVTNNVYIYIDN